MQAYEFKLPEHLEYKPDEGKLLFKGQRMVFMSADSIMMFIKEIIDLGGFNMARILIRRFAEEDGRRLCRTIKDKLKPENDWDWAAYGDIMYSWQGFTKVALDSLEVDRDPPKLNCTGRYTNSFFPKKYVEFFGKSQEPVCILQVGWPSGYASEWYGNKRVVTKEITCIARGDDACAFEMKFEEDW
jgi:predicted hydrocarbon binding protein